jgi:dihydroneopterin aldolase
MDIIFLNNLRIDTIIGIFDWERKVKQTLFFDIEMATDIRKAAASDDIAHALDYKSISKAVIQFVEQSDYQLVETLAEKVAELIMQNFNVAWVRIRLNKKGAIRQATDVGVIIERGSKI